MFQTLFSRFCLITTILAFVVVVLGAYVRLSNAGLGCPDWPGCYGHLTVPLEHQAEAHSPGIPFEAHKAWKEMIHRYLAGALGLCVLAVAFVSLRRRNDPGSSRTLPWILVALIIFQALLGRWTVTLKLHPFVVMAHLLGGLATLGILAWLTFQVGAHRDAPLQPGLSRFRPWLFLGVVILLIQISLGGWMSANYASLACPDFPKCQDRWWPSMDFPEAFHLWREVGVSYEGGVLDNAARITIHMMHRLGAVLIFLYLLGLGGILYLKGKGSPLQKGAGILLLLLLFQMLLGGANVILHLPLAVATAHNAGAALLWITLLGISRAVMHRQGLKSPKEIG